MTNIIKTYKHVNIINSIFIVLIFVMSLFSLFTFAQADSGSTGSVVGSGSTGSVVGSGSTGSVVGSGSTGSVVGSGSTGTITNYHNGSTGNVYGSGYYQYSSTGRSASFTNGASGYVPYVSSSYPQSYTVGSASFTGGNSTYVPYNGDSYPQSYTVRSASFSNGNTTYVYPQNTYVQPIPQNQVLAYTNTAPTLDAVYLSDVPSTGFSDLASILIFIILLTIWGVVLSYYILRRKVISQQEAVINILDNDTKLTTEKNHPVTQKFLNQNFSDNSDICKVEEYARTKKVLLSSEASAKIVKLSRIGKINTSEFIRSISTGEWKAIGEGDIK